MFTNKIQKLMELGKESVRLSEVSVLDEPYFEFKWHNDNIIKAKFYSYCLKLEDEQPIHIIEAKNEVELEQKIDHFIMIAKREIVSLSRKDEIGCG